MDSGEDKRASAPGKKAQILQKVSQIEDERESKGNIKKKGEFEKMELGKKCRRMYWVQDYRKFIRRFKEKQGTIFMAKT